MKKTDDESLHLEAKLLLSSLNKKEELLAKGRCRRNGWDFWMQLALGLGMIMLALNEAERELRSPLLWLFLGIIFFQAAVTSRLQSRVNAILTILEHLDKNREDQLKKNDPIV
jgi:hypothetical protein